MTMSPLFCDKSLTFACHALVITYANFRFFNKPQISYSSISPTLSDRNRFRKYVRTSATSEVDAVILQRVVEHFGWTRIAIITELQDLFTFVSIRFTISSAVPIDRL